MPIYILIILLTISSFSYGDDKLLIVGSEQDYPPFALGLTDSTADGFTVELWRAVAAEAQINSTIRVLPFRDILYEFKAKEIDVLINLAQSDERSQFADFTVPHVIVRGAIFVRKGEHNINSEAALENKRIIVLNADLAHDYAVSMGWKNQLELVATAEQGFQLLASGQHDALLISKLAGQQTLEKLGLTNIEALPIQIGFAQKFSFAVHKGNAELLAKINEGLALTKANGIYDALYDKWFGVYEEKALLPVFFKYLSPIIGIFMLVMGASVYRRNRDYKQYVRKLQENKASLEADLLGDIILRRGLEFELKNMIAQKNMAINALNAGVFVWHFNSNRLVWDDRMRILYDVPENVINDDLYYDFWVSRIHPDDKKKTESLVLASITGTNSFDAEFRVMLDNGNIRHIRAAAILERDENAYPIKMVGVNLDISDIKRAEALVMESNTFLEKQVQLRTSELNLAMEVAEQANSAKTDFLANMSHELRTPMNAVIGLAYLLKKQELSPAALDVVNKIDAAGRSLLGIINECLDFSKIESNCLDIESAPFRLSNILENLVNIISTAVGKKPVKLLIMPLPDGVDYLCGDATRLEQILVNLMSNAIKFTEKGEVVFEVSVIDSVSISDHVYLHFSVRDTGIGIPPEKQESIFYPFMQADNSTTRVYGGTGLGLSISRRLVELMGGTLQLNSQVDVGSEFFFDLILAVDKKNTPSTPELSHKNILIISNNDTEQRILKSMISSFGWNAEVADCCETALLIIANKKQYYFNLLLLDWSLSDIDGIETVNIIQNQLGKEYCPTIIMVAAYDNGLLPDLFGNELADKITTKPVTESSLFNAVLEVMVNRGELVNYALPLVNSEQLAGLNLLVVDDSEINREVAYQILIGKGANVEVAENGREAIVLLMSKPDYFDVVLMDVQMPVMDGYTATKKIRMIPELKRLPIIALTAGAFKIHREDALTAGMNDFIAKPFEVEELVECIQRLTHQKNDKKANTLPVIQTQPSVFDAIPLIDVEHGLKKWREVEVYQKHLRLFLQQHRQDAEHIHTELSNEHQPTVMEINHKLLGSAGALSLQRIVHLTKNIESTFSQQGDIESLIIHFAPILAQTFDAINVYLTSVTPQKTEQITIDNANTVSKEELKQLIVALNSDDINLIEPKISALSHQLPKELFDNLSTAVENFDFRQAEIIVNALIADKNNKEE